MKLKYLFLSVGIFALFGAIGAVNVANSAVPAKEPPQKEVQLGFLPGRIPFGQSSLPWQEVGEKSLFTTSSSPYLAPFTVRSDGRVAIGSDASIAGVYRFLTEDVGDLSGSNLGSYTHFKTTAPTPFFIGQTTFAESSADTTATPYDVLEGLVGGANHQGAADLYILSGIRSGASNAGSADVTATIGNEAFVGNFGTGNINTARGFYATIGNIGASGTAITNQTLFDGVVNNARNASNIYGLALRNWTNSGAVENSYGLYLDASTDVGTAQSYALYSASPAASYLAGSLGLGTSDPKSMLHVADGEYAQFEDNNAGAPPAGDCDNDNERGRMSIDTANNRLYICNGATRGWDYIELQN